MYGHDFPKTYWQAYHRFPRQRVLRNFQFPSSSQHRISYSNTTISVTRLHWNTTYFTNYSLTVAVAEHYLMLMQLLHWKSIMVDRMAKRWWLFVGIVLWYRRCFTILGVKLRTQWELVWWERLANRDIVGHP